MRVDFESFAKTDRRFAKLIKRHVAKPLSGSGAEVIGVARQSLLAVGNRTAKVLAQVAHGRALVPALGETGLKLDDTAKELFRVCQLLLLHSLDAGAKHSVGFRIARAAPSAPENRFGRRGELRIVTFQRFEGFFLIRR